MIGQELRGYRITKEIKGGGMGEVYLAERADAAFQRQAIIKVVGSHLPATEQARFQGERQALALINHPNVAQIYDGGQLPTDGRPFMIMEFVEGEMLRYALCDPVARRNNEWLQIALPAAQAVEIAVQACAGLGAAHERQIVHRDIKPENIVVQQRSGRPVVKIIDFGLALPQASGILLTHQPTEGIIGTAAYMSPEQIAPEQFLTLPNTKPGPASDIYSLGVVVYEMLTGALPFSGSTGYEFVRKHIEHPPRSLRVVRPDLNLPPALDAAVLKALSKRPEQRQRSMAEFAAELQAALQPGRAARDSWNSEPTTIERPPKIELETTKFVEPPNDARRHARRRWLWSLPAVLLLLVIVAYLKPWQISPGIASSNQSPPVALTTANTPAVNVVTAATLNVEVLRQEKNRQAAAIASEAVVHSGEGLRLALTASASGSCVILQKNAVGKLSRLFPDPRLYGGSAQIAAGQRLNIPPDPGWFRLNTDTGIETVYVLFAADQADSLLAAAFNTPLTQAGAVTPQAASSLLGQLERHAVAADARASGTHTIIKILRFTHEP
jgi:serine/threonine protein kinase